MAPLDELLEALFGDERPAYYEEVGGWLRDSRRFQAFAAANHSKIRAKLRGARDAEALADVRAELETAYLLLGDRRFTLEYEKYAAAKQRGPDFTVTYRTHTPFNVEVRRIRGLELAGETTGKLVEVLADKVRQMPPSIPNLLWLIVREPLTEAELAGAPAALRLRAERALAERTGEAYFTRRGYRDAAEFLRRYQQLSGIVLRQPGATLLWLNPVARHKAPPDVVRALEKL